MKIKQLLIILTLLTLAIAFIFLYNLYKDNKTTIYDHYSYLYNILDYNIETIESNMNKIAIKDNNEWIKLKDTNITDNTKINTYNDLIKDLNESYKYYTSDKSIIKFKNLEEINIEALKEIQNTNYIDNFKKYSNLLLSEDERENTRLKTQISIMIDYDEENLTNKTFETYLYIEVIRTNILLNLTRWLELEYNSTIN